MACWRMIDALVRRAEAGDIEALSYLSDTTAHTLIAQGRAARGLNGTPGYSWFEIGRAVGTSAQAAHQRWGSK